MRQYKILSETVIATLEEAISKLQRTKSLKDFRVEGFAFDGTNYVALVSYES